MIERVRVVLTGAVQGVGFRPFVYRLAGQLQLSGWVLNSAAGLVVEVEGASSDIAVFLERLETEHPPAALVLTREVSALAPFGASGFRILSSDGSLDRTAGVLPDLATCPACLAEISTPGDRRYGYAFTNCTLCGPRYTIVRDIPYDRPNTTMRDFALCDDCRREYLDPADRRFHAQPVACPRCGPHLNGTIASAAAAILAREIVALKGIGGFQLLADARNEEAVSRLRARKGREEKPFAMLMPDLETARRYCRISPAEERLLTSAASPIVLLDPGGAGDLAPGVSGNSPYLGVMLPYSPLHHLLMRECPFPVIATSGNRSDEPIAIDNGEARERLAGIADFFLMHNRPVARPCDDSVVRLSRGREMVLRRARGYAPLPLLVPKPLPPVLAVGAHLKNTIAIALGRQVVVSQHIGDLDTLEARLLFEHTIDDLCRLYRFKPEAVACDLHPDYASTAWAKASGLPVIGIQHHYAHAASCAAENALAEPYLAVSWDGTGYGLDGTIWGGEIFLVDEGRFERISHLRPFRLPGGEAAVREGWRGAASVLADIGVRSGPGAIHQMLSRDLNSPWTTSVGRLFDAVASITGVAQESKFEGQAAMLLEWVIRDLDTAEAYPLPDGDWRELVEAVLADMRTGTPAQILSAKFHNSLVQWMIETAERASVPRIVLSGGVFQNRYLTERAVHVLESGGFRVYTHQRVPANDGGIALGQAVLAGN